MTIQSITAPLPNTYVIVTSVNTKQTCIRMPVISLALYHEVVAYAPTTVRHHIEPFVQTHSSTAIPISEYMSAVLDEDIFESQYWEMYTVPHFEDEEQQKLHQWFNRFPGQIHVSE